MRSLLFTLLLTAAVSAGNNGGYAGSYLRMGLGARAISMGNTGVAAPVNAYSAFYNPAAFGRIDTRLAGLSYSFLSLDRHSSYISDSMKIPPGGGFSIGWIESGVGELNSYNSIGAETGEINQSANAVYFSFGRPFGERLSVGVSIKILFESINDGTDEFDYNSNGVGFDFGAQYILRDDLVLGYQIRDINSKLKASTGDLFEFGGTTIDKFPVIQKLGAFYSTPVSGLHATYEFEWSDKSAERHHLGVEYLIGKNLGLRGGYSGVSLTYGAGMDFDMLGIESFLDYAFLPSVIDEGSSHIFSWQLAF